MNKSVYSLVLTDEVVDEIDRVAYEMNTSRSNMINQILAEYVSFVTPEKRMREIFDRVERMLVDDNVFKLLLQPSDSMFSMRSTLSYKYNPTVRYSVELYENARPFIGELRVSVRSQNSTLVLTMLQFFKLWTKIEQSYVGRTECMLEDGRYVRKFRLVSEDAGPDNQAIGEAIAAYIDVFDKGLKFYFNHLTTPGYAITGVEQLYADYVHSCGVIL